MMCFLKILIISFVLTLSRFDLNAIEDAIRIVAYVDREIITADELKVVVESSIEGRQLKARFQGEDLAQRWANLEKRILQEMITRRLIARDARRRITFLPPEEIESRIVMEVQSQQLENKEQLRTRLRESGVAWKDFLKKIQDEVYIDFYIFQMTRRQNTISPRAVREFYEQHQDEAKVEHRSVDGLKRQIILQTPEVAVVDHMIIKPDLSKKRTLEELSEIHSRMKVLSQQFARDKPKKGFVWAQEAQKQNKGVEVLFITGQECERGAGTLGNLDEVAFTQESQTWSRAELTLQPTAYQQIQTERWDFVKTLEIIPGRRLPFREVRDQIKAYLRLSIRDRELQILKERLWKSGSVKIVGLE